VTSSACIVTSEIFSAEEYYKNDYPDEYPDEEDSSSGSGKPFMSLDLVSLLQLSNADIFHDGSEHEEIYRDEDSGSLWR
jgi:hypothetical protein